MIISCYELLRDWTQGVRTHTHFSLSMLGAREKHWRESRTGEDLCRGVPGKGSIRGGKTQAQLGCSHKEQNPRGRVTSLVKPLWPGEEGKQRTFCIAQSHCGPRLLEGPCFYLLSHLTCLWLSVEDHLLWGDKQSPRARLTRHWHYQKRNSKGVLW